MTRVDFHFNAPDKLQYGSRLVRKIYNSGQRVVVHGLPDMIAEFDQTLWTFSALDFIPHVAATDPLAAQTPVLLCSDSCDTPHIDLLVNLAPETPSFFSRFERLIEVVCSDEQDRALARERWRFYKDRGYAVNGFDLANP
ncbi:MAG: DNA polymerase III subunit chi [Quisquiliibacterium sp.]